MIEGADRFTYLGLVQHQSGTLLVFREGALVLDLAQSGWGVMPHRDLRRLMPASAQSSSSSSHSDDSDDDSDFRLASWSDADTLGTSDSEDAATLTARARSPGASPERSPSPEPHRAPHAWRPAPDSVGWNASDAPVAVWPLTQDTLARLSTTEGAERRALMIDLQAGRLPRPSPGQAEVGVLVLATTFGEPQLNVWLGRWSPAGDAAHQRAGLTPALACALVAHARACHQNNLSAVLYPDTLAYEGLAQNDHISVLAFDRGMLVQQHPDADLVGWHDLQENGRCAMVTAKEAYRLNYLLDNPCFEDFTATSCFLRGMPGSAATPTDFYALVKSVQRQQWRAIHVAAPMAWVPADDPRSPGENDVLAELARATLAPFNDAQHLADRDPLGLGCGRWKVPWLLGAVRLLTLSNAAPELLKTGWHDTLQPALQTLLQTHRAQEKAWLAAGLIRQSVDGLIDLSRRDTRLRRPEVRLSWPASAVDDLFRTLAPHARVQVLPTPATAAVDKALAGDKPVLLLFQSTALPEQSAALATRGRCVSEDRLPRAVGLLAPRVSAALAPQASERLVALVTAG